LLTDSALLQSNRSVEDNRNEDRAQVREDVEGFEFAAHKRKSVCGLGTLRRREGRSLKAERGFAVVGPAAVSTLRLSSWQDGADAFGDFSFSNDPPPVMGEPSSGSPPAT